jgi:hypothetical protein
MERLISKMLKQVRLYLKVVKLLGACQVVLFRYRQYSRRNM